MKIKYIIFVLVNILVALAFSRFASASAPKVEAESMVKRGIAYIKANGKDKALSEFSNQKGQFVKGELYIYVVDQKGIVIAHGTTPKLIGKNFFDLKDANGKLFIQEIMRVAKSGGWVEYKWNNPVSKKIENKFAYVETIGGMFVICGVYR